ncbi:MAG: hypothetical protein IJH37_09885 [Clostridia bacterium]|nr:hypothetical protein [Clostridia bacterium]
MNSTLISACVNDIRQAFKHTVVPMPLYIEDVVTLLDNKYNKDIVQLACDDMCTKGLMTTTPDPDGHVFLIEHIFHSEL